MNPLGAGSNLLAANEKVIRVGEVVVLRGGHRVERTRLHRVLVHHEEISPVLLVHDLPEPMLRGMREIRGGVRTKTGARAVNLNKAGLPKKCHAFLEREKQSGVVPLQRTGRVLLTNALDLRGALLVDTFENVHEEPPKDVKDFVVMLVEAHLHVHSGKLAEMTRSVVLLGAEDGADLEAAFEAGARGDHLLVELRRLREADLLPKVVEAEHLRTTLRGAADELGGMHLDKRRGLGEEERAEKSADDSLDPEDGLVGPGPQIDPSVVEPQIKRHRCHLLPLCLCVRNLLRAARRVLEDKGQTALGAVNAEDLDALKLNR